MTLDAQKTLELATAVQTAKAAWQAAAAKEKAAMQGLSDANAAAVKIRQDMETQIQSAIRAAHDTHTKALSDNDAAAKAVDVAQAALDAYTAPAA